MLTVSMRVMIMPMFAVRKVVELMREFTAAGHPFAVQQIRQRMQEVFVIGVWLVRSDRHILQLMNERRLKL